MNKTLPKESLLDPYSKCMSKAASGQNSWIDLKVIQINSLDYHFFLYKPHC